jgi:hypothetical protein
MDQAGAIIGSLAAFALFPLVRVYGDILPFACACRNSGHSPDILCKREIRAGAGQKV